MPLVRRIQASISGGTEMSRDMLAPRFLLMVISALVEHERESEIRTEVRSAVASTGILEVLRIAAPGRTIAPDNRTYKSAG
jgi:hypothetical protein